MHGHLTSKQISLLLRPISYYASYNGYDSQVDYFLQTVLVTSLLALLFNNLIVIYW